MLLEGDLSDDNGRDSIKERLRGELREDPFKVRGLYADRALTRGLSDEENYVSYTDGTYAHGIWLEMMIDFGVILGTLLLLIIILRVKKMLTCCTAFSCVIPSIFVCCGLMILFFSSSFITNEKFFFLLGLTFNLNFMGLTNKK